MGAHGQQFQPSGLVADFQPAMIEQGPYRNCDVDKREYYDGAYMNAKPRLWIVEEMTREEYASPVVRLAE